MSVATRHERKVGRIRGTRGRLSYEGDAGHCNLVEAVERIVRRLNEHQIDVPELDIYEASAYTRNGVKSEEHMFGAWITDENQNGRRMISIGSGVIKSGVDNIIGVLSHEIGHIICGKDKNCKISFLDDLCKDFRNFLFTASSLFLLVYDEVVLSVLLLLIMEANILLDLRARRAKEFKADEYGSALLGGTSFLIESLKILKEKEVAIWRSPLSHLSKSHPSPASRINRLHSLKKLPELRSST